MRIKMLRSVLYGISEYEAGKEFEIDNDIAERWIRHKIAESVGNVDLQPLRKKRKAKSVEEEK